MREVGWTQLGTLQAAVYVAHVTSSLATGPSGRGQTMNLITLPREGPSLRFLVQVYHALAIKLLPSPEENSSQKLTDELNFGRTCAFV